MGVSIRTSDGPGALLAPDVTAAFRAGLHGELLTPDSPGYDEARTVWNGMIERRPGLIARCTSADDVAHAVRFARSHRLLVSVRGGGHNIAGNAICDGGLMIDLSPMNTVRIDTDTRTARVGPGATLGDIDAASQAFGLATPLGINSTTGIAGLTLGGGFGWLSRRLGLTIDNLVSVHVVTAEGVLLRASETEHPDLFWGIRGGGGNFGIVTSFELRLFPVGPQVLSGLVVHPLADATRVLRFYREFVRSAPEELVCFAILRQAPPLPFLAAEWHGREILVLAMCWSGDIDEGERITRPLREFGAPIADVVSPHPYTAWQAILDPLLTPGARNYWKSHDFREVSDGLIDVLVDHAQHLPDPQTEIAVIQLGGAVSRVPQDATAYGHRDAEFVMNIHGRWSDAGKDDACIAWTRALHAAVEPHATGGVYVNFLAQDEAARTPAAYGPNLARLQELKRKYDPTNLFRVNQNIPPLA